MYIVASLIGIISGILGGLFGLGGGLIMIPALVYLLKFDMHLSQGTTLAAMIPPIGILAAYEYYKSNYVNIPVALFIACGFIVGAWIGAKTAISINDDILKKMFGGMLFIISLKMIFGK